MKKKKKLAQFRYGEFHLNIEFESLVFHYTCQFHIPSPISVISKLPQTKYKKNSIPVNNIIYVHVTKYFWSQQKSPNPQSFCSNTVVQNQYYTAVNTHILIPESKGWLLSKSNFDWEVLRSQSHKCQGTDTDNYSPDKVAGLLGGAFSSVTNASWRLRNIFS